MLHTRPAKGGQVRCVLRLVWDGWLAALPLPPLLLRP
jgi:hypothetical protein